MRVVFGLALLALFAGCETTTTSTSPDSVEQSAAVGAVSTPVDAFIAGCVNTVSNQGSAEDVFKSLGFKPSKTKPNKLTLKSSYATATLFRDHNTGDWGQCSVTPISGSFGSSVAAMNKAMVKTNVQVRKIPGEEAWHLGSTGSIALVSRSGGAMTRTQPGVFRG